MKPYTIVAPDQSDPRVPGVAPLQRFLEAYEPGRTHVLQAAELDSGPEHDTDTLLIALPSALTPQRLTRLRARHVALFDFFDAPAPAWLDSDQALLRDAAPLLLKTTVVDGLDVGLDVGVLPMPLSPKLGQTLRARRALAPWFAARRLARGGRRRWDLALQGSATYEDGVGPDGRPRRYHQRIDWLREVRARPDWRFWGGLYPLPYCPIEQIEADCGPVRALLDKASRLRIHEFFDRMADTRVALAPMGHTRWTYRHIEAVYAGCEVVSGDLRGVHTLPALPTAQMTLVPDRAPIAPAVDEALARWGERAERRAAARERLESQLHLGRWSRTRTEPYERFRQALARAAVG
jgi:hypothetical protein